MIRSSRYLPEVNPGTGPDVIVKGFSTNFLAALICLFSSLAHGNTGAFFGAGNQVIPIKNDQIQLVREKVRMNITIEEDNGSYGLPFIPWVNVSARFHFRNLIDGDVSLQMGFPFHDLRGFGNEEYVLDNLDFRVVSDGGEVPTEMKQGLIETEHDPDGVFKKVFAWPVTFGPLESKTFEVSYRMLMAVNFAIPRFRYDLYGREKLHKFRAVDRLVPTRRFYYLYITKTAYTWSGEVEEAVFEFDGQSFYAQLDRYNFVNALGQNPPEFTRPVFWEYFFPSPAARENGVYRWTFKDKLPEEGLVMGFGILYIPSLLPEMSEYYASIVPRIEGASEDELKSVIRSYYEKIAFGKEPEGAFASEYFEELGYFHEPMRLIFDRDRKAISEIADDFEASIR